MRPKPSIDWKGKERLKENTTFCWLQNCFSTTAANCLACVWGAQGGVMNWHIAGAVMLIQAREPWGFPPGTSNLIVPCHLLPFCLRTRLSTSPQGHTNTTPPPIHTLLLQIIGLFRIIALLSCLGSEVNLVQEVVCHNLWHRSELTGNGFCHQLEDRNTAYLLLTCCTSQLTTLQIMFMFLEDSFIVFLH